MRDNTLPSPEINSSFALDIKLLTSFFIRRISVRLLNMTHNLKLKQILMFGFLCPLFEIGNAVNRDVFKSLQSQTLVLNWFSALRCAGLAFLMSLLVN